MRSAKSEKVKPKEPRMKRVTQADQKVTLWYETVSLNGQPLLVTNRVYKHTFQHKWLLPAISTSIGKAFEALPEFAAVEIVRLSKHHKSAAKVQVFDFNGCCRSTTFVRDRVPVDRMQLILMDRIILFPGEFEAVADRQRWAETPLQRAVLHIRVRRAFHLI